MSGTRTTGAGAAPAATIVQRAALLMASGDLASAEYLLANMDVRLLDTELRLERNLLLQRILRRRRTLAASAPTIAAEAPSPTTSRPAATVRPQRQRQGYAQQQIYGQQQGYGLRQGELLEDLGDDLEAARGYWQQMSDTPGTAGEALLGLWRSLNRLSADQLEGERRREPSELRGWMELAALSKSAGRSLAAQLDAYESWQSRNPAHPAARYEPPHIGARRALLARRPQRIALLLPLSGPLASAGVAIRDGFMAGYYQMLQDGHPVPQVDVVNSAIGNIIDNYNNSIAAGAEMVIGPLDKERVQLLQRYRPQRVPTLWLNSPPPGGRPGAWLSLAVESEAAQAAERIWSDGHRRVLALTSVSNVGRRAADAFAAEFEARGGEVLDTLPFEPGTSFSAQLMGALHIDASNRRANRLRTLLGRGVVAQGRRRKDLDAIFIDANPVEARQLKPLLAFHLAQDVPVYGTARIYSGMQQPKINRDMDGMMFLGFSWLTERDDRLMASIVQTAAPAAELLKLYGLGVDAWYMHQYLVPGNWPPLIYHGSLGAVTLDAGTLQRRQPWMQMRQGRARALP